MFSLLPKLKKTKIKKAEEKSSCHHITKNLLTLPTFPNFPENSLFSSPLVEAQQLQPWGKPGFSITPQSPPSAQESCQQPQQTGTLWSPSTAPKLFVFSAQLQQHLLWRNPIFLYIICIIFVVFPTFWKLRIFNNSAPSRGSFNREQFPPPKDLLE